MALYRLRNIALCVRSFEYRRESGDKSHRYSLVRDRVDEAGRAWALTSLSHNVCFNVSGENVFPMFLHPLTSVSAETAFRYTVTIGTFVLIIGNPD